MRPHQRRGQRALVPYARRAAELLDQRVVNGNRFSDLGIVIAHSASSP